jgi:Dyp-type peroxidase family
MTGVVQADLQGNILCGYGRSYGHGLFMFLRVDPEYPEPARRWLSDRIPQITTALRWREPPEHTLNVALTVAGLRALGVPEGVLAMFPEPFRAGMQARWDKLGDVGPSHPDHWEPDLKGTHILVTVSARDGAVRDQRRAALEAEAQAAGLAVATSELTDALPEEKEHFGFRDGISQPSINDPNAGPWRRTSFDAPVAPGEFVLGYEDEGGTTPPPPPGLGFNGSYMVVRKLAQNVRGFRDFLVEEGGVDKQECLAAKIVGRWRNGSPLILSPERPDDDRADDLAWLNEFTYALDPDGFSCPIGAHIRRANPRDSLDPRPGTTSSWAINRRHRILRRGREYGTQLTPEEAVSGGGDPSDDERGLHFICLNGNIARQFEFVNDTWLNDPKFAGLYDDADPLVAPSQPFGGTFTVQSDTLRERVTNVPRFVSVKGGAYFFLPGIAATRWLAGDSG